MASSFSTSLKFEKMTTGEKAGLWGTTTNTNLDMVEQAVGGYVTTTNAYTAVNGDQVIVDTSAAAVTVTLPASPAVGNEVHFLDGKLSFNSNNLTIGRNSQPIQGSASDLTVSTNGQSFTLVYANSTKGWVKKHFAGT
jgi:hypothetical protein